MFIIDNHIKAACKKFLEDLKEYEEEQCNIYSTILYFIHSAPNLSIIFLHWSSLRFYEKLILNNQMKYCMPVMGKILYPPLISAFQTWDQTQDVYGAPGYACTPSTLEISEAADQEISKMLNLLSHIIDQIEVKRKLVAQIKSSFIPEDSIRIVAVNTRYVCNTSGSGDT